MVSVRTRVLLAFILLTASGVWVLGRLISRELWPHTQKATEESLVETAALLASLVEARGLTPDGLSVDSLRDALDIAQKRDLHARIYELQKDVFDLRVYLTDAHGIVVYDSDHGRDEGRNYSRWNDVARTLDGRYGARATRSDLANPFTSVLYVAAPVRQNGQTVGVLSVGKPVRSLELIVGTMRRWILWMGLLLVAFSALVSLALAKWLTLPIERLTAYARAIGQGGRPRLPRLTTQEIDGLGRAMESMRDALEGKRYVEGYVRSLTHEIKAPLSAIRASAELLDEEMALDDRRRFLKNIRAEAERLQSLIDRMLELSAVEARRNLAETEPVDWDGVARDVCESVGALATQKGVRLTVEVDPNAIVQGDRFLLRQALVNLARNAVAATPGGGWIRIGSAIGPDSVEVTIVDSGPRIPDYALPRVFERFYTVPVGDPPTSGTGLGLPFVREVALLHGGEATLVNLPGGGVQATLRLPRTPPGTPPRD